MNKGFTLLELLIVITLVALLATLGLPNMFKVVQQNRVVTITNDWMTSVMQARVEALKIRQRVSVCASNDPFANAPVCGGNWENGWIIIADSDGDDVVDRVIDAHAPVNETIVMTSTIADGTILGDSLTYNGNGFFAHLGGTVTVCGDDEPISTLGTSIVLNDIGRVRLANDVLTPMDCS